MTTDPSGFPLPEGARVSRVDVGTGVSLQVVEAGPTAGHRGLVVLAHGFPETWYSWRHQIPALAAAGYRVAAPNLRGYAGSDKPRGTAAYSIDTLAADFVGLTRALGEKECVLVGHDWGGPPCWRAACDGPVRKLVLMNTAPLRALLRHARRSPTQGARLWYMAFFQLPRLPELFMTARGGANIARALAYGGARERVNTREDCRRYAHAFLEAGVATAAINYYRAAGRQVFRLARDRRQVNVPTLVLWGTADAFLEAAIASPENYRLGFSGPLEIQRLEGVGHWIQQQAPEDVNRRLIAFLGQ